MAERLSRRKIADYVADQYIAGKSLSHLVDEVAAYLIESGRTREAELTTRAINDALAERGVIVAEVTTAFPLAADTEIAIKRLLGKGAVIKQTVDPAVLGGVRIEMPGRRLDATIAHNLTALRRAKL